MRNQIGVVVDVGQTCRRCTKYREAADKSYWCSEYDRLMNSPRYICKNFIDREAVV